MIESEAYSELFQTSKVVPFAKTINSFKKITIFKRNSVLEILTFRILNMFLQTYSNYPTIQRALSIVEHSNQ